MATPTTTLPDYTIYILLCFLALVIIGGFFLYRKIKKNKTPVDIPQDVLKEFNRAEELAAQYKGAVTPQQILWQINEERGKAYTHLKDVPKELLQHSDEAQQVQPQQTQTKPKLKLNFKWK